MMPSQSTNFKFIRWTAVFFAIWFVLLCVCHLLHQRPLWNDEAAVFESVQFFSPKQIFSEPLRAFQVFPRTYLFLIQQVSKLFNCNLFVLRLPSFICMIAGFFIWLRLANEQLKDKFLHLIFVGSWIASGMLLYYSAELKQYSMDVMAASIFLLFLYHQQKWEQSQFHGQRYALVFLSSLVLFSYPAFLFAPLVLWNLILSSKRNRDAIPYLCIYAVSLCVFVGISYFFDMRLRPVGVLDEGFGDYMISFSSVGEFLKTFGEGINNLFSRWFVEYPKYFKGISRFFVGWGLIYMVYGFFKNIKKDRFFLTSLDTIALVLFVELFILGALRKYPFTVPRTSLFFCPIVLYMTIKGIGLLKRWKYAHGLFLSLYIVFLLFLIVAQSRMAFMGQLSFYPRVF